jgi:hypothetical protein
MPRLSAIVTTKIEAANIIILKPLASGPEKIMHPIHDMASLFVAQSCIKRKPDHSIGTIFSDRQCA